MAVRSRRFWTPALVTAANTFTQVYDVPDGRTARMTTLSVANIGAAAKICRVWIGLAATQQLVFAESVPSFAVRNIETSIVLNPDDRVFGWCDGASYMLFTGYGSLLLGAPA